MTDRAAPPMCQLNRGTPKHLFAEGAVVCYCGAKNLADYPAAPPHTATAPTPDERNIYVGTVGDLRRAFSRHANEAQVLCQVVATNGEVWNVFATALNGRDVGFKWDVAPLILKLTHPELQSLRAGAVSVGARDALREIAEHPLNDPPSEWDYTEEISYWQTLARGLRERARVALDRSEPSAGQRPSVEDVERAVDIWQFPKTDEMTLRDAMLSILRDYEAHRTVSPDTEVHI